MARNQPRTYRTLFISDVHLGSKPAKAEYLIDFLRHHEAERIYLVGDIDDGWLHRRYWDWPQLHNDVVQKILQKDRKVAKVTYLFSNHDEFFRLFKEVNFGFTLHA